MMEPVVKISISENMNITDDGGIVYTFVIK